MADGIEEAFVEYLTRHDVPGAIDDMLAVLKEDTPAVPWYGFAKAANATIRHRARDILQKADFEMDVGDATHQTRVAETADALLDVFCDVGQLDAFEADICRTGFSVSEAAYLAMTRARSKLYTDHIPEHTVKIVIPLYDVGTAMLPRAQHLQGHDFVRTLCQQLQWLYADRRDCSAEIVFAEGGCPQRCGRMAQDIIEEEQFTSIARVVFMPEEDQSFSARGASRLGATPSGGHASAQSRPASGGGGGSPSGRVSPDSPYQMKRADGTRSATPSTTVADTQDDCEHREHDAARRASLAAAAANALESIRETTSTPFSKESFVVFAPASLEVDLAQVGVLLRAFFDRPRSHAVLGDSYTRPPFAPPLHAARSHGFYDEVDPVLASLRALLCKRVLPPASAPADGTAGQLDLFTPVAAFRTPALVGMTRALQTHHAGVLLHPTAEAAISIIPQHPTTVGVLTTVPVAAVPAQQFGDYKDAAARAAAELAALSNVVNRYRLSEYAHYDPGPSHWHAFISTLTVDKVCKVVEEVADAMARCGKARATLPEPTVTLLPLAVLRMVAECPLDVRVDESAISVYE